MTGRIHPIAMPKWGLAMTEGKVVAWLAEEGAAVTAGDEVLEIETTKITNVFEAPSAGVLRRRLVAVGETVPVGRLLGVLADGEVPEAEIDAFLAQFRADLEAVEAQAEETQPQFLEADGRRLRYLKMGEHPGIPVLLLHGFGADLNNWMFNQPALAEKLTVYALDLPGHGASTKDVGDGSVGTFAEATTAFLKAAGAGKVHLVGHSLGGAVALETALRWPALAASVTLISAAGLGPEINAAFITGFIEATRRKELQSALQLLVHDPSLVSRDMIEEVLKFKRVDGTQEALRRIASATFPGGAQALDFSNRLSELAAPCQVIWGKEDRVLPVGQAERLPAGIEIRILEGAGHMPHMEQAAEVNRLVLGCVAR